jgi:hypothetical protein
LELLAAFSSTRHWLPALCVYPVQTGEEDGLHSTEKGWTLVRHTPVLNTNFTVITLYYTVCTYLLNLFNSLSCILFLLY